MSFPQYPTYKDSSVEWLGEVPGHWDVKRLRRTISVPLSNGIFKKKEEFGSGTLLVNVFDIYREDFKVNFDSLERVKCDDNELSNYEVLPEDLFFVRSSLKLEGIAVVAMADSWSEAVIFECHLIRARPNRKVLSGRFASYVLNSTVYRSTMIAKAKITTMTTIDQEAILSTYLPVPPLPEQSQIAAFLDRETAKIDALVAEQRRLMELLKEKRQAVISHAVTRGLNPNAPKKPSGNKWLGDVPEHWIVCCLKHIKAEVKNAFVDGPFGSNLKSEHFVDDGDVYVIESNFATQGRIDTESLKTISKEHFATINRSETRGGDIVIAKIGAQYGKASILPPLDKPAVVSGNSLKLTINQKSCDVKFVNWHLANLKELGVMEDIVNATAQPALSLGEMHNLPMLVPPRAEQEAIVHFLNQKLGEFDTLTSEAQRAIDLLQERRTALISAAVTGQIDVRSVSEVR